MNRNRKHVRLRYHDYSSEGWYFITINTKNREHYFGEIENDEMVLNAIGSIADFYLKEIPKHFSNVIVDEMIVMPNHIHCILILGNAEVGAGWFGTNGFAPAGPSYMMARPPSTPELPGLPSLPTIPGAEPMKIQFNKFSKPVSGSISVIIQQFKTAVTRWCNKNGFGNFCWQPKFHDRVIRDYESYKRIKNYIINNPKNWKEDGLNKRKHGHQI